MQQSQNQSQQALDCLELSHLIGYSGAYPNASYMLNNTNLFLYSVGAQVVLENLTDKHDQSFIRGHDAIISSIQVSNNGNYLATGQFGSPSSQQGEAPVILWDLNQKKVINVYRGLKEQIKILSFSPDDLFLAASSASNTMTIWNTQDFGILHNRILETPTTIIQWCPKTGPNNYQFVTAQGSNLIINNLTYNPQNKQCQIAQQQFSLPSSGLVRQYTKSHLNPKGDLIFLGTTSGEICIFNLPTRVFKAAIPISNNGVLTLLLSESNLFVGSGDGRLKKLTGAESRWAVECEVQLDQSIQCINISNDKKELLVGCASSKIYRVLTTTLDSMVQTEGHSSAIMDIAFQKNKDDIFATIEQSGFIFVWDNNTMNVITKCSSGTMQRQKGTCVCIADDGAIVGGFEDGFVRAFNVTSKNFSPMIWEINNAHNGPVTRVYTDPLYVLTGGRDGIVRVWSRSHRQMITQIQGHTKDVVTILPDLKYPNILHSASIDKIVLSYDLKQDKKVVMRNAKNGFLYHMTQRPDTLDLGILINSHCEILVTCGQNMPMYYWNIGQENPINSINFDCKLTVVEASPSGKYIAAGNERGEIQVVDHTKNNRIINNFGGHSFSISKLKWTSDEKQVLSVSLDGSICVWNFFPN